MSTGPPVPPCSSLMNSYYNDHDDVFGNDLPDIADTALDHLPYYTFSPGSHPKLSTSSHSLPTMQSYTPSMHGYPPQMQGYLPPAMMLNSGTMYSNSVPSYEPPQSPTALSPPPSELATVPSPLSPPSPPATVPIDVPKPTPTPTPVVNKVKPETHITTDSGKWEPYVDNGRNYCGLYNSKHAPISNTINLRCRLIAEKLDFSAVDAAYILYRQNQLHVEVDFVGGSGMTSYCTNSPEESFFVSRNSPQGPQFISVEGLYFYMYSVKHLRGQAFDTDLVEIHQAKGSRSSKETYPPGYNTIENGRTTFSKLQFKAATANNSRNGKAQQQFYRIVVALVAKVGEDQYEYISTSMSPCYIVRGQNPKRFRDSEESSTPISSSPVATSSNNPIIINDVSPAVGRRKAQAAPPPQSPADVKQELPKSDMEKRKKVRTQAPLQVPQSPLQVPQSPLQAPQAPLQVPQPHLQAPQQQQHLPQSPQQHLPQSPHYLPQSPHHLPQSPHHPLQSPHHLPQAPHHPLQAPQHPLQAAQHPLQAPQHPLQVPQHPLQAPQHPLQAPQHPLQAPQHPSQGPQPPRYEVNETVSPDTRGTRWVEIPGRETITIKDGRVGINTGAPPEALSVNGNIMLTGSILKPSDQRIKTNIQPVSTTSQLDKIKQLKIYDYELKHGKQAGTTGDKERGLLAQELKEILPGATKTLTDVTLADGTVMQELIVVDERTLLYEHLGATQELSNIVKQDQEKISSMDKKLQTCIKVNAEETEATQKTLETADKLLTIMLAEKTETKTKNGVCCIMVNQTNKGFYGSVFSLGPAWTLYLLGLFVPFLWFFGGLFAFSPNRRRRIAGIAHILTFFAWFLLLVAISTLTEFWISYQLELGVYILCGFHLFFGIAGTIAATIRWKYKINMRQSRISYRKVAAARGLPEYVLQVKEEEKKEVKVDPVAVDEEEEEDTKNLEEGMMKKGKKYASVPVMEEDVEEAVNAVTKPKPTSIKMKTFSSSTSATAKEEWERNALLTSV